MAHKLSIRDAVYLRCPLLLLFFSPLFTAAQTFAIINASDSMAVPYAIIKSGDCHFVANEFGVANIDSCGHILEISCLGYHPLKISVDEVGSIVYLHENPFTLDEIIVKFEDATELVNKANNNLQQRSAKDINAEYDWHGSDAIDGKIVREGDVTYVNKISNKGKIDCHIMTKDVSIAPEFKEYTRLDSYAKAQFRQYELSFKFDKHIKFYRESRDDALQIIKFSNHKTGQKGKIFIDSDTVLVRYETNIPQAKKIKQNKYSYQLKSGIGVCGYVKTPQGYVFDFGEIEAKSELQKSACLHFLLIRSVWKLKKISNDAIPRNIKVRSLFSKEIYDLK